MTACRYCDRRIVRDEAEQTWVDPQATGDDAMWRETCDAHDTFTAEHEPATSDVYAKLLEAGIDRARLQQALDSKDNWGHMVHAFEFLTVVGVVLTEWPEP